MMWSLSLTEQTEKKKVASKHACTKEVKYTTTASLSTDGYFFWEFLYCVAKLAISLNSKQNRGTAVDRLDHSISKKNFAHV